VYSVKFLEKKRNPLADMGKVLVSLDTKLSRKIQLRRPEFTLFFEFVDVMSHLRNWSGSLLLLLVDNVVRNLCIGIDLPQLNPSPLDDRFPRSRQTPTIFFLIT
jgi:hypothetical protein